jgi:hypothetical protein
MATFSLLRNYIRNPAKILAICQNLVMFFLHQSEQARNILHAHQNR